MLDRLALILVVIGAINWGSIGLFQFDIVGWAFGGQGAAVSRVIYTIVALAGIWCISLFFRERKKFSSATTDRAHIKEQERLAHPCSFTLVDILCIL